MSRRPQRGFTLIELMIVVAIIGILAAVAIPAFMKYVRKSKTTEARQLVKKIYDGARAYYLDQNYTRNMTFNLLPRMFPRSAAGGLTPSNPTACCDKCAPNAALWTDETWVVLQFSVDDPHYYSYDYIAVDGTDPRSRRTVPTAYTARAHGDLDCDDTFSTFEMYGTVHTVYADGAGGSAGIYRRGRP